jgi:hypothetical protein
MPSSSPKAKSINWKAKSAFVAAADGEEWDQRSQAYDDDWKASYCAEFRRFAKERGWNHENIESGWLEDSPSQALHHYPTGSDPAECARLDVVECEDPMNVE